MSRRGAAVLLAMATTMVVVVVVPAMGASAETTDGIWRSEGYGTVLAVGHGRLTAYETTAGSCLPSFTAMRTGPATFTTEDRDVYTFRRVGGQVRMHIDGSPGDRVLRAAPMPPRCGEPTPKDPLTTFDVFWRTFDENYPFFAAKGVDWRSVRDRYRPQVTSGTTDARLAEILDGMIAPLNDAHTYLAPGRPPVPHIRPGTVLPSPAYDQEVTSFIEEHDLHRTPTSFAKGRIRYADLPHHLGYLRISGFGGYTDANDFAANSAALTTTLDTVLTGKPRDGLIIDLRVNGGGSDSLGLQIAARLTGHPYLAYAKRARNGPAPQPIEVRPAHAPRYEGPVAVLTGGSTFSAGETFTQALMGRTPRPVRIGQNTQGVFSDILERTLPNGWTFGLPNEEFLTREGWTFDGAGIPPDVRTPGFGKGDPAFEQAVRRLSSRS